MDDVLWIWDVIFSQSGGYQQIQQTSVNIGDEQKENVTPQIDFSFVEHFSVSMLLYVGKDCMFIYLLLFVVSLIKSFFFNSTWEHIFF